MKLLTYLVIFIITLKFQCIRAQLIGKDDYFNHREYELPEFIVDESLFTTEKQDAYRNPLWTTKGATAITTTAKSASNVKTAKSTTRVTTTMDTKLKKVQPSSSTIKVIRSSQNNENGTNNNSTNNNDTNNNGTNNIGSDLLLPVWSRFSHGPSTKSTIAATTTSTTKSTTISYTIRLTPKSTTKPKTRPIPTTTIKQTPKSTARSIVTSTTKKVLTIATPIRTTSLTTKNLVLTTPNKTTTITWFVYLPSKTKKTNNITTKAIKSATTITTNLTSTVTLTVTTTKTTTTNEPTENSYFEARLNKIRPANPTIATIPIVFQDLTMIRNGPQEDVKIDGINQTKTEPAKYDVDLIIGGGKARHSLRDKETIEYRELTTEPFSKFLELLTQQLAVMDSENAAKFLRTFERQLGVLINLGRLDALGPVTNAYILEAIKGFQFPIDHKQRLLSMAHNILANRNDTLGPEVNSLLDYMDMLYAVKAEMHMERVLNETMEYPNGSKTPEEITEGLIEDVLLNPLRRISGTTQGNKLLAAIGDIISNKNVNFNARRVFSQMYYKYPKRNKKVKGYGIRKSNKRRRPKFVIPNKKPKTLFVDENGWVQKTTRARQDTNRMTIVYRDKYGDIKKFLINSDTKDEMRRREVTKKSSHNFANRNREIKGERKFTFESNNSSSEEKTFRASFNNNKQNKFLNNPFRTLLYKNNKNRYEKYYTDKDTYEPRYQRTTPTITTAKQVVTLTTSPHRGNINYNSNNQSLTHELNTYHKQKVKYNNEANEKKIKNVIRQSLKFETNSSFETESKDSDEIFTTTTTRHTSKPNKLKKNKVTHASQKHPKGTDKNKSDTETTLSEFKEANVSLKHFYFKPVIMQNKSGDDNEFISIEFDGEPNVIDFSMKVKLKKPITQAATDKESDFENTDTSKTTTSPSTSALRILNPYKMDTYFKNNGTEHENSTANDKESSNDSSGSSSDSGKSEVSSKYGKDSQPHVFGKLRKLENRGHQKEKLRSKKHGESKKHHHERKHEKYKGHHKHGKHGKKHRYKYLQAYLKKDSHNRKKKLKHKLKQLKDKRIVGKNFEIAFDASSGGNEDGNLIDVTIIKRAKYGKRATISLVNNEKKSKSSDSTTSSEEEVNKHATAEKEKSSISTKHIKHKSKKRTDTTMVTLKVVTAREKVESFNRKQILRNKDHSTEEEDHLEHTTDNAKSTEESVETLVPKDTIKNKMTGPEVNEFRNHPIIGNRHRKRKKLSPLLIQINTPHKVADNNAKYFRKVEHKIPKAQRRFVPVQVFNNSEYSDEEADLKKNLYDAFRHQDELYYRRNMRHELPLKQELREESDVTDEETIFKENIYKAIKENNRRSNYGK